jgi:iron complex outermembrane receptor protein
MTLKTTKLRDAITFALAAGATTLAGTGVAFAQETEGQEATTLDRIEVTGSRIKRADIETSQPIFTLSREDIQAQGLTSIGDVIQNITANGATLNTTMNNGGNGETRVDLRNLGSNRTLVLVNGRRWVGGTGLGGSVDLNTIPTAAVERIEVLKDGASVIYGSDAIAGVVNVILRTNFDGAEANAYIGQYDKGDGNREAYDFTVGSVGERWAAMLGVGYVKEEPVLAGDREISEFPVFKTGTAFGSSTTPDGRFALCTGTFDPITGTCDVRESRPDGSFSVPPAGNVSFTYDGYDPALTPEANANNWRNRTGADVYNFAPDNYLLTPQERISLFTNGSLDITDNIRFKVTAQYNERKSEQLLAAMPIVLGSGPGASPNARAITISPDSIYNPFGETVSRIQRRANDGGLRSFRQDVDTWVFNGSFEGDFEVGERFFSWDAGYFYGENEASNVTEGLFNLQALRNGLGPSMLDPVTGRPICVSTPGVASTVIGGCVPINLLGGLGSLTPEMLQYASFAAVDRLEYLQKTYYANISGDLFEMPAGPFSFAAGYEHRTESGRDQPDPLTASGDSTGNNRLETQGRYGVDEVYLELAIPILADVTGAQLLDVSLAGRYSDYDTFGDTTNAKFGFRWKPIDDLLIRGNWTQGFRAPSISELFAGEADNFPTIGDPCSTTFGGSFGQLAESQQERCEAQGVPVVRDTDPTSPTFGQIIGGGYDQGNAQIRTTVGGNTLLLPETSETKTLGFVYSPAFLEGFDISLDWWKIEVDDAVTIYSGQQILDGCITGADAVRSAFFCDLYTRSPGGAIDRLLTTPFNASKEVREGWDMTVNYRLPEYSWGRLSFTWDNTYLSKAETFIDGVSDGNNVGEYPGGFGPDYWRVRSNLATRWELGDFGAAWNVRYYSRLEEACPFYYNDYGFGELCSDPVDADGDGLNDLDTSTNKLGGVTYHDISGYWNAPWNAKITLGINNVFDKDPPVAYSAFANSFDAQYEVPGQFFYMRYTQKF